MATKKRGLGRGIDSLLGDSFASKKSSSKGSHVEALSVDLLQRGQYQPRQTMAEGPLAELAQSIAKQGIIQPIIVRKISTRKYEIIAGERRWQAAKIAGLKEVPVVIRDAPDRDVIAMSLIENIQRENLNPLEEARAMERLIKEFGLTQQKAADAVGKSRPAVSNLLRLLTLPSAVKGMLAKGLLEMGHARALLSLDEIEMLNMAKHIVNKKLSVREAENLVKKFFGPKPTPKPQKVDPNIRKLEQDLSEILKAKVSLKTSKNGRGSLVINYNSLDELEGIIEHIK